MTLPPERAAELLKSPKTHKWKMIKAKVGAWLFLVYSRVDKNNLSMAISTQREAFLLAVVWENLYRLDVLPGNILQNHIHHINKDTLSWLSKIHFLRLNLDSG